MAKLVIVPEGFDMSQIKPAYGFKIASEVINQPILNTLAIQKGTRLFVKFITNGGSFLVADEQLIAGGIKSAFSIEENTMMVTKADPFTLGPVPMDAPKVETPKKGKKAK